MGTALPAFGRNLLDLFARGELARKGSQHMIAEAHRLQRENRALREAAALNRLLIDVLADLRTKRPRRPGKHAGKLAPNDAPRSPRRGSPRAR